MNIITRRAALGGLALLTGSVATLATARTERAEGVSSLSELISNYRRLCVEEQAAWEHWVELDAKIVLPDVTVTFGTARILDENTGQETWGQWSATTAEQIRRHYEPLEWMTAPAKAKLAQNCAAVLARLQEKQQAYDEAKVESGLAVAQTVWERANASMNHSREAIFAYRPATIEEMERKNDFLAELNVMGEVEFSERELALIFGERQWLGIGVSVPVT